MSDYKQIDKLNQSLLKKILISPKAFLDAKAKYEQESESTETHFIFGTVVDIMLTGNKEEFDSKFLRIPDSVKCGESVKVILDKLVEEQPITPESKLEDFQPLLLLYCNIFNYQTNWKDETRVAKIITLGEEYFNILKLGIGKQYITESEYNTAVNCVAALKSDFYTQPFVDRKFDRKNVEFLDKFVIEFQLEGIDFKGELDRVAINHVKKLITPIDFKTTGKSVNDFEYDFWAYRYDFQAATYSYGLVRHPKIKALLDDGYTLDNFLYIAVEKSLQNKPRIFKVTPQVDEVGFNGGEVKGREREGLMQAIARYKFAVDNDAWDHPVEYYINKGFINITV